MVAYDDRTALVVVDVQNDFADPKGSLYVRGGEEVPAIVNKEIAHALSGGAAVFYTQDWHPEVTPHFEKDGGVWPVHCVEGSWGAGFHPDLEVAGEVVRKGTGGEDGYSGFTVRDPAQGERKATALHDLLVERGVRTLVIAGIATDYCVKETALDGLTKGYDVTVLTDAVRAVDLNPGDGERALREIADKGAILE